MNHWGRRTVPALALCLVLTGCQSRPAGQSRPTEGEYIALLREAIAESARLKKQSGEEPRRSEQAVQAVRVWRGTDEE